MHLDQTKADKGDVQKIIDFGIELDGFLKNKNLKAEQLNNYETNAKRMLALVDKLPKIQINSHDKSMQYLACMTIVMVKIVILI
ncbi:conserved domain protein [Lactobacillus iners UPII 143-D]|nr:hypothetical protein [Lactobacillus iners]EGC79189.1 conserved domain protein [Lactobacillus iners UPII 143-D]